MPNFLVECVPNFSEARRPAVIEAILAAIAGVPQVHLLDRHSDLDHNRTVLTLVGTPEAMEEGMFRAIACAAELISLETQRGAHPRLGATDVVPFVPLQDTSMQTCIEIARRLGKRVANELSIPVYLYEEAATRPERQNLENIRRGEYEALKAEISSDPNRAPDFGPCVLTPAGATIIGARQPLIAFNVYLTSSDISIAQKVAKAVRWSSGGLQNVKALGLLVAGRAQVSMNLTHFRQTPIARVVEFIRREAERYGVAIHHSELVGLIPQEALLDAAVWYTQLDDFKPDQVLEYRLAQLQQPTISTPQPVASFLDHLAEASPTPAGGSASAYSGAMAAALVALVARATLGNKKFAAVKTQMWNLLESAESLRTDLTGLVERDAAAFQTILAAMRLPQSIEKASATQKALLASMQLSLEIYQKTACVLNLVEPALTLGNPNAAADAATAVLQARACLQGSAINLRANARDLSQAEAGQPLLEALSESEHQVESMLIRLRNLFSTQASITL